MTRRFEIGPVIVAVGALVLLVSLFLEWYGNLTAWGAFELADILLAAVAVAALIAAVGLLAPELSYVDGSRLPALALAATVLVVVELISPPPIVAAADPDTGAWLGFAAALVMLLGAALSVGKVSFSLSIEGRERRQRVSAVDHRQDTTDSPVVAPEAEDEPEPQPAPTGDAVAAPETRAAGGRKR